MKKRIILTVLLIAILTAAGCFNTATNGEANESVFSSQTVEIGTKAQPVKSETDTQSAATAANVTEAPKAAITAPYSEEYEHMPLDEKPYQATDVSDISKYFVHKKVGSGQDMELYLELLDKETDGLYCTVKNNKNVWRVVQLSVCDLDEKFDNYISTSEKFAPAPDQEVVVKLNLNAGEYESIDSLDLVFFCNGLNYSAEEKTANIKEKEPDLVLNYFLYVRYAHEAVPWNVEGEADIDLTENFIRGFGTCFFTSDTIED